MSQLINKISGGRSIIESLVIVVSILLAFAIEAWWAEQLESITESKELDRLHTEFTVNRDRIDRSVTGQELARTATADLYNIIKNAPSSEVVALPDNLLQAMLFTPTFDVATPVLNSLVLSGNLSVIEDSGVLAAIATWQRVLAQVTESELGARDFTNEILFPNLIKRGNIGPLLIVEEKAGAEKSDAPRNRAVTEPESNADESVKTGQRNDNAPLSVRLARRFNGAGETPILVDNELKGIIAQRIREAGRSAQTLSELENSANRLISAIEEAQSE